MDICVRITRGGEGGRGSMIFLKKGYWGGVRSENWGDIVESMNIIPVVVILFEFSPKLSVSTHSNLVRPISGDPPPERRPSRTLLAQLITLFARRLERPGNDKANNNFHGNCVPNNVPQKY